MIRYFESLFLGPLIACTALIIQVFLSIFAEIFFAYDFTFQNSIQYGISIVFMFFLINALIEEVLRYIIIKKRIIIYTSDSSSLNVIIVHGILLGCGFWLFELFLTYFKTPSLDEITSSLFITLIIHIISSIFLLHFIKKQTTIPDFVFVLLTVLIHTIGNGVLYFFVI
ncbi:MAG: hypothetical protein CR972_00500 [Candidatus Moraniibacteriota bacterium]|nr:MAG: hypothetical protein CR972_00500 [Candidatus Moranbacteria bacterium]